MRKFLLWWRELPQSNKDSLKSQHKITVVTFDFICKMYNIKKIKNRSYEKSNRNEM